METREPIRLLIRTYLTEYNENHVGDSLTELNDDFQYSIHDYKRKIHLTFSYAKSLSVPIFFLSLLGFTIPFIVYIVQTSLKLYINHESIELTRIEAYEMRKTLKRFLKLRKTIRRSDSFIQSEKNMKLLLKPLTDEEYEKKVNGIIHNDEN